METDHTGALLALSRDILSLAVSFSGRKSVDRFGMTSRFCHSLVNDDDLWYNLLMREWKGISMSLHDWGAISSWRGVWNALNRYINIKSFSIVLPTIQRVNHNSSRNEFSRRVEL